MNVRARIIKLFAFLILFAEICCSSTNRDQSYRLVKNLNLKSVDGFNIIGDVYIPKVPGKKPAVVVVHGGGWENRSGDMRNICDDLARAGFVVLNTTYRLAPKNVYPKAVEDVRDAVVWLKQNAEKYEIDVNNISGWGYSAGAHLILLAGIDGSLGLKSIVAGGTPADLTVWPKSKLVKQFIGKDIEKNESLWREASPVNHVTDKSPPLFLYHGEWDKLVEHGQMLRMRDAMLAKNRHVETHTVNSLGHVFVYLFSQESVELGIKFLKSQP